MEACTFLDVFIKSAGNSPVVVQISQMHQALRGLGLFQFCVYSTSLSSDMDMDDALVAHLDGQHLCNVGLRDAQG